MIVAAVAPCIAAQTRQLLGLIALETGRKLTRGGSGDALAVVFEGSSRDFNLLCPRVKQFHSLLMLHG